MFISWSLNPGPPTPSDSESSPPMTSQPRLRSRSGCLTCRRRRVKCDGAIQTTTKLILRCVQKLIQYVCAANGRRIDATTVSAFNGRMICAQRENAMDEPGSQPEGIRFDAKNQRKTKIFRPRSGSNTKINLVATGNPH
ncbi:hypothetical protein AbraCBS73388_006888 [Aspergillus brasiliensis]|uniref:Zn(2)-C6 fungal-type domain-containing protein n=1 Tax=Aspergillus brasiliensis TaxID=319629 RepID=A0A9W5YS30_9EURO|nr:hypothetical protein AbraCBS73388_006888 [Aspergillus brasiliensis]